MTCKFENHVEDLCITYNNQAFTTHSFVLFWVKWFSLLTLGITHHQVYH